MQIASYVGVLTDDHAKDPAAFTAVCPITVADK